MELWGFLDIDMEKMTAKKEFDEPPKPISELKLGMVYDRLNLIDKALENPKIKEILEEYIKDFTPKESNVAIVKKLTAIAQEMGLNINDAIKNTLKERYTHHGTQFIYGVTKYLAIQLGGDKYQMKWNQLLRKLGFHHLVDTKDSSAIHPNEPTQGVFMDTSKIEQVGIILNKQNLNPRFVNDLTRDTWIPKTQKTGLKYDPYPASTTKERTIKALRQRINTTISHIYTYNKDEKLTSERLTMLIKLIKTLKSIDNNTLTKNLAIEIGNTLVSIQHSTSPEIKQKVQIINNLIPRQQH